MQFAHLFRITFFQGRPKFADRHRAIWAIIAALLIGLPAPTDAQGDPIEIANVQRTDAVSFEKDVLPILQRNCLACHSASERQGELVLESPGSMRKGGDTGPALIPGRGSESLLLKLASQQTKPEMPPKGNDVNAEPLTPEELGLIRLWIDQGAKGASGVATLSPKAWQSLPSRVSPIYSLDLSEDGQYLVASRANQLFLYHVPTGRLVTNLSDPAINVSTAVGSSDQHRTPAIAHHDLIQSVALNLDGDLLASGSFREVKLWRRPSDVQSLNVAADAPLTAVAVSPDRLRIATADANHQLQIWDASTGSPGPIITGHTDRITSLRFTPDGRLMSASIDQSVRVWNVTDGSMAGLIETPGPVSAIEITATEPTAEGQQPLPTLVVSGGPDKLLRTWTIPDAAPKQWDTIAEKLIHATASFDQRFVALVNEHGLLRVMRRSGDGTFSTFAQWNLQADPLRPEPFPANPAVAMAFITDSAQAQADGGSIPYLATSFADGSISLWSLPNHELIARWRGGLVSASALASSGDGKQLASGSENGALSLWNLAVETPPPLPEDHGSPVNVVAISPSRTLLAIAGLSNGKHAIFVRDLDKGSLVHTLTGHDAAIASLSFSSDNKQLVSGSEDHTIRVWELGNAKQPEQHKLEGFSATITAVAFSPDASQIISGTADHAVQWWNLADHMLLQNLEGHSGKILGAGFMGSEPFSISADRSIRFWNPADGKQSRTFNHPAATIAWALSPDGQQLALAADDKNIRLYQMADGKLLHTLTGHTADVVAIAFAADGKRLTTTAVVTDQPSESAVWDLATNPPRMQEMQLQDDVTLSLFDKRSDHVIVGNRQGKVRQIPLRFARYLDGNQKAIRALKFHSNGQTLFSAAEDGSLRGYATASGQQTFAASHGAAITSLSLSPDEQVLATAGENGVIRVWQTNGAAYGPQQISGLSGPAKSVAFSSDNTIVLAAGGGEKPSVIAFDLKTGTPLQHFTSHQQPVFGFVVSPTGTNTTSASDTIVSLSADSIWQWSTLAGKTISGHGADVTSLAAMPGAARQIVSGSMDSTVRHWNLGNGQQIRQFNHGGPVLSVAVRSDGQRIASASSNHTAKLWSPNGQQIAEMRGDVRLKTQVTRAKQQQSAASARVNAAKQRADAAEKDVPKKTEAEKKAADALAAANKDVTDKQAELDKTQTVKIAAEKEAIEAAAAARLAIVSKTMAEVAHQQALAAVPIAQQRAAQLAAAVNAAPANDDLRKAAEQCVQAVADAQQQVQTMKEAMEAPTKAAADAAAKANEVAQKVSTVQKPYNDALAALKVAMTAQNLASQQHVLSTRELKAALDLMPRAKQAVGAAEMAAAEVKKQLEEVTKLSADAELAIRSIRFSPDGSILLTAGDFQNLHSWDADTGTAIAAYAGHSAAVAAVAFLNDEKLVSISADQSLRVWQRNPDWRLERTIGAVDRPDLISHRVMSLDFNADASQLLVAGGVPSRSGELHIFDVSDGGRSLYLPQAHDDVVYAARFSPDGKRIASAGADKYLRTFDVASSQLLRRFEGHTNYVLSVAWKGDGQTLASAAADQTIKVWDAETADQKRTISNYGKHVTQVAFIGETDNIVSSCGDRLVRTQNTLNGGNIRNFSGPDGWLHCVDIVADSSVVATGTDKGTVYLWNGTNGQQQRTLTIGQ